AEGVPGRRRRGAGPGGDGRPAGRGIRWAHAEADGGCHAGAARADLREEGVAARAPEVVTNATAEVRLEGIRSRRKVERQRVARDVRISGLIEHDVRSPVGAGRGAAAGTTAAEIRRVDEPGGVRVQLDDERVGETTID